MASQQRGGNAFYGAMTATGLLLTLFSLAWGHWSLSRTQDRLFGTEERALAAKADFDRLAGDVARIEAYKVTLDKALAGVSDRTSARFAFLTNETERTARRLQTTVLDRDGRKALWETLDRRRPLLERQMRSDGQRSEALTALGLSLSVFALILWYLRRQRWLDRAARTEV